LKNRMSTKYLLLTFAATALLAAGCGEETTDAGGQEPYPANEPKYVLANVELAFNADDLNLLDDCLAGDFMFYFDEDDVGQEVNGYVMPLSWTRQEFLTAVGNLFDKTFSVTFNDHWREVGTPGRGEQFYLAPELKLQLSVMVDSKNGYVFDDGSCDYEFTREPGEAWFLSKWRDRSRECGCLGPYTFGRILAGYHP
jgi:hypothetical protein